MKRAENLTGRSYGRLVVLRRDNSQTRAAYWICRCDCGKEAIVQACHLRSGATKSCGCFHDESARARDHSTHGGSKTRLFRVWKGMKSRCYSKSDTKYKNYGGRGIKVCDEWQQFESFRDWALANGYRDDLTIDRIDVNGNYEPSNCRWITNKEQQNNRTNNLLLTYSGKTQTLTQWAEETGINEMALRSRIKKLKWPVKRALTEPINVNESAK